MRVIHLPTGALLVSHLELALTYGEKLKGMLERACPPEGYGLLLPHVNSIHMVGMRFPLDVLFLDKNFSVLKVEELLPPGVESASHPEARYTLEMTPGTLERVPVQVGDKLTMEV